MNDQTSPDDEITPLEAETKPVIYSKRVIYIFSVLLPGFGGILLAMNLKDTGEKKAANLVLLGSIAYTLVLTIIEYRFNTKGSFFGVLSHFAAGFFLSEYVFQKYFPDAGNYAKKPVWIPSVIGVAMFFLLVLAILYGSANNSFTPANSR